MATPVTCPSCEQSVQVPDEFLGKHVECPGCQQSFVAASREAFVAAAAPPPAPDLPRTPPGDDEEFERPLEDDEEQDRDAPRKKRRKKSRKSGGADYDHYMKKQRAMWTPHRGVVVLTFGIFAILFSWLPFLNLGACACGYYAYNWGNHDENEMIANRMDPSGRGLTIAGKIMGIIGMLLSAPFILLYMCCLIGALINAAAGLGRQVGK
jgi:hypothetical protein